MINQSLKERALPQIGGPEESLPKEVPLEPQLTSGNVGSWEVIVAAREGGWQEGGGQGRAA